MIRTQISSPLFSETQSIESHGFRCKGYKEGPLEGKLHLIPDIADSLIRVSFSPSVGAMDGG